MGQGGEVDAGRLLYHEGGLSVTVFEIESSDVLTTPHVAIVWHAELGVLGVYENPATALQRATTWRPAVGIA